MRKLLLLACLAGIATLASCASKPPAPPAGRSADEVIHRVMKGASSCWFKSEDPAFKSYRMDAELTSFSGQPRILLVRKGSSDIRPLLVVMAMGNPAKIQAFGPLMNESLSARISTDIKRWVNGSPACR
ncbi:lysylphosphatidylglycerol synthetase-like protein (DUF2156 family) [Agrobacterium vitis]|nr:lysylphosphatidylglycerol synthetase-like protein (DUF2156 family) [Agrobacterium vitis]MBE1438465.1 lysylphosphatidylglycerol synthetase-like protein (DUF2156 family) [Agrobacterium vitis]